MKKRYFIFLIIFVIFPVISAELEYVPGEVLVKFRETSFSTLDLNESLDNNNVYEISVDSVEETIDELLDDRNVEYAEPNYIYRTFSSPNDPSYSLQWFFSNSDIPLAWNITTGNSSVVIAVIDTGVEWYHSDLQGNIWNNTDEACDDETDLDGNGFYGDCRGYDFVNGVSDCYTGDDCDTEDNDPDDIVGHGTHVSGIAAAVSNNSQGVSGVCWNCKIMPVRAGYLDSDSQGSLKVADIAQAIHYSTDNGADIISMSFGGTDSLTMQEAINYAYGRGVILVASAGNNGKDQMNYPAAYDNVISVAATGEEDSPASYSNFGDWVNIAAPGGDGTDYIWSTYLNGGYAGMQGTSMAAPVVSGAIGLLKSVFPNKNQSEILNALQITGEQITFSSFQIPLIKVYSAIIYLDEDKPSLFLSPENSTMSSNLTQRFNCNVSDIALNNMSFYLYNSTSLVNQTEINLSGNSYNFSSEFNLSFDAYLWGCSVYDENNNYNSSGNYSLSIAGLFANIVSPANNTYSNQSEINFTCSLTTSSEYEVSNLTLYIWNSTSLVNQSSNEISGLSNSSIFSYNFSEEGEYTWGCFGMNNQSNNSWTENYTLIYDATSPEATVSVSSVTTTSAVISFNASEESNASVFYGSINQTNSTFSMNHSFSLTGLSSGTSYSYRIDFCDRAVNCNSTSGAFTTTAVVQQTSSSSGGGGGGGSVVPVVSVFQPSSQQVSSGYTQEMKANDKIILTIFDENEQKHTVTVNSINSASVKLIIQSEPVNITLGIGQSARLNLTSSEYYNLYLKLESIRNGVANLTVQTIHEPIPGVLKTHETPEVSKLGEAEELPEITTQKNYWLIFYCIIALVLFVAVHLYLEKMERKRIRRELLHGMHRKKRQKGI